jgi:hypothetical protein
MKLQDFRCLILKIFRWLYPRGKRGRTPPCTLPHMPLAWALCAPSSPIISPPVGELLRLLPPVGVVPSAAPEVPKQWNGAEVYRHSPDN